MQFEVRMRDGSAREVEASYIEVTRGVVGTYTLLRPVPGFAIAVVAAFPVELVTWVCAIDRDE